MSFVNPLQQGLVTKVAEDGEAGVQHTFNAKMAKYDARCEADFTYNDVSTISTSSPTRFSDMGYLLFGYDIYKGNPLTFWLRPWFSASAL